MTRRQRFATLAVAAIAAALYVARLDRAVGLIVDDAWYVLLAKALARGDGFRLTSSAAAAILPSFPPGFPAVLSVVFRVHPRFPDNVILLKSISVLSMLGAGAAAFRYVQQVRRWPWEIAIAVAALTVVTPAFVFLATSAVMAECLFTCLQLLTILEIERAAAEGAPLARAAAGGVLSGAAWLIKASATPLIAAGVLYLAVRRPPSRPIAFAAAALACVVPWQLYAAAHAPTAAERTAHSGSISVAYGDSFRLRIAGTPRSGFATPGDFVARVAGNAINVAARDVAGVFVPAFLRGPAESGEEVVALGGRVGVTAGSMGNAAATEAISLGFALVALVGFVRTVRERVGVAEIVVPLSLAMIVAVPFHTFRYVAPLAPFLFCYFAAALGSIGHDWRVARVALLTLVALDLTDHASYIVQAQSASATIDWLADARDVDETIAWVNGHLPADAAIASSNPGLVYLETGRKGVAIDDVGDQRRGWLALGIRYVAELRPAPLPDASAGAYRVLYRSRRGLWVVDLGA